MVLGRSRQRFFVRPRNFPTHAGMKPVIYCGSLTLEPIHNEALLATGATHPEAG